MSALTEGGESSGDESNSNSIDNADNDMDRLGCEVQNDNDDDDDEMVFSWNARYSN